MAIISKIFQNILIAVLRLYRCSVSTLLGNRCRFHPSCSQYAIDAIQAHGSLSGCFLTIKRLLRCHPWHVGGWDPVPPKRQGHY